MPKLAARPVIGGGPAALLVDDAAQPRHLLAHAIRAVPPWPLRAATAAWGVRCRRKPPSRRGSIAARSASEASASPMSLSSHRRTSAPVISCASLNGTPLRASQSATSVASVKPSLAWRASTSTLTHIGRTMPLIAGSTSASVSTASKAAFLSSMRSRL